MQCSGLESPRRPGGIEPLSIPAPTDLKSAPSTSQGQVAGGRAREVCAVQVKTGNAEEAIPRLGAGQWLCTFEVYERSPKYPEPHRNGLITRHTITHRRRERRGQQL